MCISNEGKEVSTYIEMHSSYKSKTPLSGPGNIGNGGLVIRSLGLTKVRKDLVQCFLFPSGAFNKLSIELSMQVCSIKMKYTGYSTCLPSNSVHRKEKVYKLQIVEIGAIKEIEPVAPDWAAEAAQQPLVPAQLTHGVPTQWLKEICGGYDPLRLLAEQYKTFMDQIGQPYERRVDFL